MVARLDEFLGERRTGPGCRVCGKPQEATVKVILARTYLGGLRNGQRQSISKQAVLCADHAVELYEQLTTNIP